MAAIRLGKVQLRIMQVLWRLGRASAREITESLNLDTPIAHSTVQTLLRKMEDKGVVSHDAGKRVFVFQPLVDPNSITRSATEDLIDRMFGGSAAGLVAHLLADERISKTELNQLRELIDRHERKKGSKP